MTDKQKWQGWGWPERARKAHYFDGEIISLCRGWMFSGDMYDNKHDHTDNCKACRRKLRKLHPEKFVVAESPPAGGR